MLIRVNKTTNEVDNSLIVPQLQGFENVELLPNWEWIELNSQWYIDFETAKIAKEQMLVRLGYEPTDIIDIADLKQSATIHIKKHAKTLLDATDYKVTRHIEQNAMQEITTLTSEEFNQLLTDRQAIRDESNVKELAITTATTIEEITVIIGI